MTLRHYIDGAEVVGAIRTSSPNTPGGGFSGLTSSADGTNYGSGGVVIDDRTGSLDLKGWRPYYAEEDTASPVRVFTGYINARKIGRSDLYDAASTARVWDCDLGDMNLILGFRCFRGSTAKRAAETDEARIAYMLGASTGGLSGLVYDNGGVISGSARDFGEADLRGQFPEQVLGDLAIDVRYFFLYWDETAASGQERSLFYNGLTNGRGNSTTKLSNGSDVNGTTILAAHDAQEVIREPGFTYSGVYLTYRHGTIYRTNATTASTYVARDQVYQTDRIGLLSTAEARAAAMLSAGSTEKDVLTCTIHVPSASVNLVREGYRIQVKFTHLPAYTSYTWVTVKRRTIRRPENGSTSFYDIDLTLSNDAPRGASGGEGGGDPGGFPNPTPDCTWTLVQSATPGAQPSLPVAPTPGNKLVILHARRSLGTNVAPTYAGFTIDVSDVTAGNDNGGNYICSKDADGSEQSTSSFETNPLSVQYVWYQEWTNNGGVSTSSVHNQSSAAIIGSSAITVPSGGLAFAMFQQAQGSMTIGLNGGFGLTSLGQSNIAASDDGPHTVAGYATGQSGSWAPDATPSSTGFARPQASILVAYACDNAAEPPRAGQWVYKELVLTGDGTTVSGTTDFPYADGSLTVYVDILDQTAGLTAQDGAAGTFTLGFIPKTGEQVFATYQGR